ncbi:hypothetical protein Tco_0221844 [Tanacetum coccineum]
MVGGGGGNGGFCFVIDYRKLNDATRKDHFPLPFMDQMLERLAGNEYYCFLDGFSRYFHIPIDHERHWRRQPSLDLIGCLLPTYAFRLMYRCICLLREVENKLHLLGDEWENFARDNLNSSVRTLHFVNEGDDTFYITGYNRDGIEWQGYDQLVVVFPSMLMLPARTIPSYAINDKRGEHFCSWEGHIGHYTEDDVLYTILNALVYDKYMLTVPVEYSFAHEIDKYKKAVLVHDDFRYTMTLKLIPDRKRPGRRSHIKMTGNWKVFGIMCDFELPKMLRFKLVEKVKEDVEGVNMEMPLFHFSLLEVALDIAKTPTHDLPIVIDILKRRNGYSQKDKNKAKKDKNEHEIKRA